MKKTLMLAASAVALASVTTAPKPAKASADPLLGQLMLFGGNFCPRGWTNADGQLLSIAQYSALFSIFGTMYGGDGRTTFGMPDLRGRSPIHTGNGPGIGSYNQGAKGGSTNFFMTTLQMPSHNHTGTIKASLAVGDTANPSGNAPAIDASGDKIYHTAAAGQNMQAGILQVDNNGGSQPVNKLSPYQVLRWCVALQGVFPSRN